MALEWLSKPVLNPSRQLALGIIAGFTVCLSATAWVLASRSASGEQAKRRPRHRRDEVVNGISELIGNTPLIRINSLSDALGVEILGKAEYLNPGGSIKDRVALRIIEDAEESGLLQPWTGSRIFEGTSGSTGISIATIAHSRGYLATIVMPDDVSEEKTRALLALGADVKKVRPASIVDKKQFVNYARDLALSFGGHHLRTARDSDVIVTSDIATEVDGATLGTRNVARGFFADQFESRSNYLAHYEGTGPEIWRQTNGVLDAFVSGAGTGGTIAGVGDFLKSRNGSVILAVADPEGSGLHNRIKHGVLFDHTEREGTKRRHQVESIVEGIGLNRVTNNLEIALPIIDKSYRVTDVEAISMSRFVAQRDGLVLGSSSACNLVACVRLAKEMGPRSDKRIVTILCDSGSRHYSKFWNDHYLENHNIPVDVSLVEDMLG